MYHGRARAPAAGRAAVRPSSSAHSDQQCGRPPRNDNNPTDLGIATRIRASRAAVQNGQRGQRDGRPDAERAPHASPPRAPPPSPAACQGQRKPRRAIIALKPLKPHVLIRDYLGPKTTVCTHCKARHWECERSKSIGHSNTGYRQLLQGSDSEAKAFREIARSYNALFFILLAAHFDRTRLGTLGPPVFRVFGRLYHRLGALIPAVKQRPAFGQTRLIDPAEATSTRLGPDGADSRVQSSTLIKLESVMRAGNRSVRKFASAKWCVLRLCLPPGRDRRAHNLPTSSTEMAMLLCDTDTNMGDRGPQELILQVHSDRCSDGRPKYQIVSSLHPSAMPLRFPLLFPAGEDGFHPNIALCGFNQAGTPIPRNREQIENGVQLREVLVGLVRDRRILPSRDRPTQQENLRLTTAQGITDAVANGFTPDQIGCSVMLGSTFENSPREITQRYQDAMACVVKHGKPSLFIAVTCNPEWFEIMAAQGPNDKACNRPDLIARVFEAKVN
ncbi:BZ3500_MvSof-1268-A1-R1_Chr3-1g05722 [Microbotryum saponariae]|uniref:BZ3500_MvSof-1268-A1-R1_Chr3-1g05722 protein n=1 Tax=Microbotryum saponariae TaxID=289078 RepID=A0A2X0MWN1_9BASI|nr:BZ3500_MvSof-1268-A1-R1_Chr3-1g05722 [Microbotryum saponariae]SDA04912.1 BZ3501_MvSof-1269-A2-R1_Chr3-1g05392 [Microbotryum saponariae]